MPGWDVKVARAGGEVTQITWTGSGKQGVIAPGEFQDFGLSLKLPDGKAGDKLTFKALQTYDDGVVVRWIGPEDADEPAPVVTLQAGSAGEHGAPSAASASPPAASAEDGGTDTLSIVATALGALALIAALGALAAARRTGASKSQREVAARA